MASSVTLRAALKEMGKMILGVALLGIVTDLHDVRAAETRTSFIRIYESCSLTEASTQPAYEAADCKYACLAKRAASGQCAAYQWDAGSHTCRLQETLNVTASPSAQDTVGVLMESSDESLACAGQEDCPDRYSCAGIVSETGAVENRCLATDCAAILAARPCSPSGVYTLRGGIQVWCDMDTDGGGWTVFLKRLDGSVDFYQDLATYKQGFGDVSGEYWLGLDILHSLTSSTTTYELRADISDWEGGAAFSAHGSMVVAGETENYTLTLGAFTGGEGGDGLTHSNGMPFSTWDADRDPHHANCGVIRHGGFWFNECGPANPTSRYYTEGGLHVDGLRWKTWDAHHNNYCMKTAQMKLRPRNDFNVLE